jgi:hypothetical protein
MVAGDRDDVGKQSLERLDRALGPVLLQKAEHAVDDDDDDDRPGELAEPPHECAPGRDPEEHREEAPELLQESDRQGTSPHALEAIRPAGDATPRRLGRRESARCRAENREDVRCRKRALAGRSVAAERLDQLLTRRRAAHPVDACGVAQAGAQA